MLIFSISFPDLIKISALWIPLKEGFGVKGGPKAGTLQIILVFTLTPLKTLHIQFFYTYTYPVAVYIYIFYNYTRPVLIFVKCTYTV
jgi:hypothetical protein